MQNVKGGLARAADDSMSNPSKSEALTLAVSNLLTKTTNPQTREVVLGISYSSSMPDR